MFEGRDLLRTTFGKSGRKFTLDGRLVGDIGESIAELVYEVELDTVQRKGHDGKTPEGRDVQIKATFQGHFNFTTVPDLCIFLELHEATGTWEEVYNGPGYILRDAFQHWQDIGVKPKALPKEKVRALNTTVPATEKVSLRG